MKKIILLLTAFLGLSSLVNAQDESVTYQLDYDQLIFLDAEDLAEQGINEAYENIKPRLKEYVKEPAKIEEVADNKIPFYKVSSQELLFEIYGPELEDGKGQSWGRATFALFSIVNNQIKGKDIKFYAINAGNDLGGIFLSLDEARLARKSMRRKTDSPYIPTNKHPRYGQKE